MRRLEHLNALRAFEATARHLSFTKAAQELNVTQGTLSHHVAVLEATLGAKLFHRYHRAIELTQKGETLFRHLFEAFELVQSGIDSIGGVADSSTLRIKLPPTFAIRWLVPRLASLHATNPTLDVQITTSHRMVDFTREEIDVAILSGTEPPTDVVSRRLFGEVLTPVCSPDMILAPQCERDPAILRDCTLLCSLHRPNDWPMWIEAAQISGIDGNNGVKFENSSLAYQAAIDKLGVALAQIALIADDLKSGRLIRPFDLTVATDAAYYLIYPSRSRSKAKVQAFEAWLLEQCRKEVNPGNVMRIPSAVRSAGGAEGRARTAIPARDLA